MNKNLEQDPHRYRKEPTKMMHKFFLVLVLFLIPISLQADERPRIIVLTDITNEPDDQESLVRFLVYANEFEVETFLPSFPEARTNST